MTLRRRKFAGSKILGPDAAVVQIEGKGALHNRGNEHDEAHDHEEQNNVSRDEELSCDCHAGRSRSCSTHFASHVVTLEKQKANIGREKRRRP